MLQKLINLSKHCYNRDVWLTIIFQIPWFIVAFILNILTFYNLAQTCYGRAARLVPLLGLCSTFFLSATERVFIRMTENSLQKLKTIKSTHPLDVQLNYHNISCYQKTDVTVRLYPHNTIHWNEKKSSLLVDLIILRIVFLN